MEKTDETKGTGRERLIQAVTTPLAFFTLGVLIVEALLGGLGGFRLSGADRTNAFYWMVTIIVFLILLVAGLAVFRPEALAGARPDNGLKAENQKIKDQLRQSQGERTLLQANVQQLEERNRVLEMEKDSLATKLAKLDSLKSRIVAILVARGSAELVEINNALGIVTGSPEHNLVLAIIGRLAEDGKVVRDTSKGGYYYALKG